MTFKNKQNEPVIAHDGSIVWKSRSVAVCAIILTTDCKAIVAKRSDKVDHPGKWALPCGYIDWNESIHQALIREVWEELGLDISTEESVLYHVNDNPNNDDKQNITFHFGVILSHSSDEVKDMIKLCDESTEFDFITLEDAIAYDFGDKVFAFNHDERLHLTSVERNSNSILYTVDLDLSKDSQFEY